MTMARLTAVVSTLLILSATSLTAQTTTAVLQGKVLDAKGAVLVGASVEVKGSTQHWSAVTDAKGFYRIADLPAGSYVVTTSRSGFATEVAQGIVLAIDQTATLDVTLRVAPHAESVTVTASTPLIDTTESSVNHLIDSRDIASIPLNGRNYLDLIRLTPGVAVNPAVPGQLTNVDSNGAIMGERGGNIVYLIDGLENDDDFHGGVFQSFTQDAIQEFEVIDAGYKAEFGEGSGGVVNVITKSGSNQLHVNSFLFARNDALDSSNVPHQGPPTLERYDYGMTIGVPIRQNRAWFFGSVENIRQTSGTLFPPDIPSDLLAGENFSVVPETTDTRAFGKYNQHINDHNDLMVSLSWSRANLLHQLNDPIGLPSTATNSLANTWFGTVTLNTTLSPQSILESSFSARAENFGQNQNLAQSTSYSIFFLDDGSTFDFGPSIGSIQSLDQRYFTGRETFSFFSGARNTVKLGVEYLRTMADGVNGQGVQNVIVTTHSLFDQYGVDSFQLPQGYAFLHPGDNLSRLRNNGFALFAQDDWQVARSLTLSGGLRYDYDSTFDARRDVAPRLGLAWSPDKKTVIRASWGLFFDRYRLGVAQPVPQFGGYNAATLVEFDYPRLANDDLFPIPGTLAAFANAAGSPYFLNTQFNIPNGALVTESNIQSLTGQTPAQFAAAVNQYLSTFNMPFIPVDFSPVTGFLRQDYSAAYADMVNIAQPFRTPYNNTFSIGFQREFGNDYVVGATYVRRSIRDILGMRITNLSPLSATAGFAISTDGGPLQRTYGPWFDGKYSALVLSVNKRFSHRFQLQANYTFAASTDDLLNPNLGVGIDAQGGGAVPSDNNNVQFDRGNSDLFVPQSFVASGIVNLPLNFKFSGILRATSGFDFSATGTPYDIDGDGIVETRPLNTKRNQFRGPASFNLDTRFEKDFRIRERYLLSVMAEFFNLTNQANPELVNTFFVNGAPGPGFGGVRVPLPGREVQLGTQLSF